LKYWLIGLILLEILAGKDLFCYRLHFVCLFI